MGTARQDVEPIISDGTDAPSHGALWSQVMHEVVTVSGGSSRSASILVPIREVIKHLSVRKRLEILAALAIRPLRVSEVASVLGYEASDVSVHLRELRRCGLLHDERRKRERVQSLAAPGGVLIQGRHLRVSMKRSEAEFLHFACELSEFLVHRLAPLAKGSIAQ